MPNSLFQCTLCNKIYTSEAEALECEQKGIPSFHRAEGTKVWLLDSANDYEYRIIKAAILEGHEYGYQLIDEYDSVNGVDLLDPEDRRDWIKVGVLPEDVDTIEAQSSRLAKESDFIAYTVGEKVFFKEEYFKDVSPQLLSFLTAFGSRHEAPWSNFVERGHLHIWSKGMDHPAFFPWLRKAWERIESRVRFDSIVAKVANNLPELNEEQIPSYLEWMLERVSEEFTPFDSETFFKSH